jgi:hypothetical protein
MKDFSYLQLAGTLVVFFYLFLVYQSTGSDGKIELPVHLLAGGVAGSLWGFDFWKGLGK